MKCCPEWCSKWQCNNEEWCRGGSRPPACGVCNDPGCPEFCDSWTCPEGFAGRWCKDGARPSACRNCGCPSWCATWHCNEAWCKAGGIPAVCAVCPGMAQGPVTSLTPGAGWALDHGAGVRFLGDSLTVTGEARAYLVQDSSKTEWSRHKYMRFNLEDPLTFELDVSKVPCGCLACVYLTAMPDPTFGKSNYWCRQ